MPRASSFSARVCSRIGRSSLFMFGFFLRTLIDDCLGIAAFFSDTLLESVEMQLGHHGDDAGEDA